MRSKPDTAIRPAGDGDRGWLAKAVAEAWGSDRAVSRSRLTEPVSHLPGHELEFEYRDEEAG